ncbi:hypothetical protein ACFU5Z_19540 [Streptomyces sp. NPDC057521]|uniref:hypothetical protein n=1 Tax=Streptomyces sp. NPDC057521 TaxID=3346156 RepID=UPI0036A65F92
MTSDTAPTPRLVVIGGDPALAASARSLGCSLVNLQLPGSPVEEYLAPDENYYSIDWHGASFKRFVDAVIRPLNPVAVVSLGEDSLTAVAAANDLLGLPGLQLTTINAFDALYSAHDSMAVSQDDARFTAAMFTVEGTHRMIGIVEHDPDARTPGQVSLPVSLTDEHVDALTKQISTLLNGLKLQDGPSTTEFRVDLNQTVVTRVRLVPPARDLCAVIHAETGIDLERWALGWPMGLGGPAVDEAATTTPDANEEAGQ